MFFHVLWSGKGRMKPPFYLLLLLLALAFAGCTSSKLCRNQ